LMGETIAISQSIQAGNGTIALAATATDTSIGLGGGGGVFNVTDAEVNHMSAAAIVVGASGSSGNIDIGAIDLSTENTHLTLQTTGDITDTDVGDDTVANIILAANKNLTITGGGGAGAGQVGGAGLADL